MGDEPFLVFLNLEKMDVKKSLLIKK